MKIHNNKRVCALGRAKTERKRERKVLKENDRTIKEIREVVLRPRNFMERKEKAREHSVSSEVITE